MLHAIFNMTHSKYKIGAAIGVFSIISSFATSLFALIMSTIKSITTLASSSYFGMALLAILLYSSLTNVTYHTVTQGNDVSDIPSPFGLLEFVISFIPDHEIMAESILKLLIDTAMLVAYLVQYVLWVLSQIYNFFAMIISWIWPFLSKAFIDIVNFILTNPTIICIYQQLTQFIFMVSNETVSKIYGALISTFRFIQDSQQLQQHNHALMMTHTISDNYLVYTSSSSSCPDISRYLELFSGLYVLFLDVFIFMYEFYIFSLIDILRYGIPVLLNITDIIISLLSDVLYKVFIKNLISAIFDEFLALKDIIIVDVKNLFKGIVILLSMVVYVFNEILSGVVSVLFAVMNSTCAINILLFKDSSPEIQEMYYYASHANILAQQPTSIKSFIKNVVNKAVDDIRSEVSNMKKTYEEIENSVDEIKNQLESIPDTVKLAFTTEINDIKDSSSYKSCVSSFDWINDILDIFKYINYQSLLTSIDVSCPADGAPLRCMVQASWTIVKDMASSIIKIYSALTDTGSIANFMDVVSSFIVAYDELKEYFPKIAAEIEDGTLEIISDSFKLVKDDSKSLLEQFKLLEWDKIKNDFNFPSSDSDYRLFPERATRVEQYVKLVKFSTFTNSANGTEELAASPIELGPNPFADCPPDISECCAKGPYKSVCVPPWNVSRLHTLEDISWIEEVDLRLFSSPFRLVGFAGSYIAPGLFGKFEASLEKYTPYFGGVVNRFLWGEWEGSCQATEHLSGGASCLISLVFSLESAIFVSYILYSSVFIVPGLVALLLGTMDRTKKIFIGHRFTSMHNKYKKGLEKKKVGVY